MLSSPCISWNMCVVLAKVSWNKIKRKGQVLFKGKSSHLSLLLPTKPSRDGLRKLRHVHRKPFQGWNRNVSPHLTLAVTSQLLVLSTEVQEGRNNHMATQLKTVSPTWRITFPNTFALGRDRQLLTGSCCYLCISGSCGKKLLGPPLFHVLFTGLQFNKPFKLSLKLSVSFKGMLMSPTVLICAACNPQLFSYSSCPLALGISNLAFLSSELFLLFWATDSWRGIVLSI